MAFSPALPATFAVWNGYRINQFRLIDRLQTALCVAPVIPCLLKAACVSCLVFARSPDCFRTISGVCAALKIHEAISFLIANSIA